MSEKDPSETSGRAAEAARLHRYVDGDLAAAEQAALAADAARDPSIGRRIEGIVEVGELVRQTAAVAESDVDGAALFAKIEAAIELEASSSGVDVERAKPALRMIEGGAAGRRAPTAPAMPVEVRRRRAIGLAIGALAVAAAAVIAFGSGDEPAPIAHVDPPETSPTVAPPETVEVAEIEGTEVLEVDFGTNVGSIFSVEGDDGERYVVVWLDEPEAVSN